MAMSVVARRAAASGDSHPRPVFRRWGAVRRDLFPQAGDLGGQADTGLGDRCHGNFVSRGNEVRLGRVIKGPHRPRPVMGRAKPMRDDIGAVLWMAAVVAWFVALVAVLLAAC